MAGISSRENFLQMIQGARPVRLPLDLWVTPPAQDLIEQHTGSRDPTEALGADFVHLFVPYRDDAAVWRAAYEALGYQFPPTATVGIMGDACQHPSQESLGAAYHLSEMLHPLGAAQTLDQVRALPWPDTADPVLYRELAERVSTVQRHGKVAVGWASATSFEFVWWRRGLETLFMDLLEGNGIGDWLLDWATQRSIHAATAWARAGADVIVLADDIGTQRGLMMAPEFWRQHLKGRLKRVVDAIRAASAEKIWVFFHTDGAVQPLIEELVEVGIDILNPVQPECMALAEVIPAHQHHLAFWGMIGTQTTMPFGTPADVRVAVGRLADQARAGARLVVAPTHVLEPDVPWENIEALVEAVRQAAL